MSVTPYGFVSPVVQYPTRPALDGIQPQTAATPVVDDYVLYNGLPVVPTCWCNAQALVTTDGTHYGERASILDVNSDAYASFIPNDSWDDNALVWTPTWNQANSLYRITSASGSQPLLDQIDYQIGREAFSPQALVFNDNTVMTTDFNQGFDDALNFTLSFAVNLRDPGPMDLVVFMDGSRISLTETGLQAVVEGRTFNVKIPNGPLRYTPLYVVLEVLPPKATLTVGYSPTKMYKGTSSVDVRTTSLVFTLSGVMDLLSLDLWGDDAPSATEVIARYSSVMGVN